VSDVASAGGELWTRRRFLSAAGLALLAASSPFAPTARAGRRLLVEEDAAAPNVQSFLSRPDLTPLAVTVNTPAASTAPGYVFAAPFVGPGKYGPLILDNRGKPVWFRPIATPTAMNFRVQRYRGEPVLTWWQGKVEHGYGGGTGLILDHAYERVAVVKAGNGYHSDLHEFIVTSRNTALIAIYQDREADFSAVGGPVDGRAVEGIIQETDIASGRVLFEWHSLDHVPLEDSYLPADPKAFDYFHLNSIAVDNDGHLLVSARHTSTVYKIDRHSGEVIWRLGGKKSDFAMGPGAAFNFQHDARRHADGTITVFDNGAFAPPGQGAVEPSSRPMRLVVDTTAMRATLAGVYEPASPRLAIAMGDLQQLPDGGAFVGWGTAGSFTEFAPDGTVVFDAAFAPEGLSYRAFRYPWVGRPATLPDVVTKRTPAGKTTIHVSWNGATEVARWLVTAGARADLLRPVRTVPRTGFETVLTVPRLTGFVAVTALDRHGRTLATSRPARA
jgi:hypothetical protein